MAKVKLEVLMGCGPALSRLNNQPLSARYTVRLAALSKAIEEQGKIEFEARKKLLRDHGAKEDSGGNLSMFHTEKVKQKGPTGAETEIERRVPIDEKKWEAFQKAYGEMLKEEVEITPVDLSALADLTISALDVLALDSLIVWEKSTPKQGMPPA
jgi:hypothetical protein